MKRTTFAATAAGVLLLAAPAAAHADDSAGRASDAPPGVAANPYCVQYDDAGGSGWECAYPVQLASTCAAGSWLIKGEAVGVSVFGPVYAVDRCSDGSKLIPGKSIEPPTPLTPELARLWRSAIEPALRSAK